MFSRDVNKIYLAFLRIIIDWNEYNLKYNIILYFSMYMLHESHSLSWYTLFNSQSIWFIFEKIFSWNNSENLNYSFMW